ncbi:YjbF family lipoprotein [Falsihalocynthiibacter sp. BN13B15]|uniref:YjbF family lipoprotein n=1 Tax=Falsihalocynthiibacter sp. BN13B15 TaxID=3240871 RepID=UPI00350ED641
MSVLRKTLVLFGFCFILQSCGNDGQKEFYAGLWDTAKESIPSKKNDDQASEKAASNAQVLAQIDQPLILASSGEVRTALVRVSLNGDYEQWHSSGKIGFTFKDGLLTATRGLGGDLMNADVQESLARLKSNSSQSATRVHRYLSGVNTIVLRSFVCFLRSEGPENTSVSGKSVRLTRVVETCENSDSTFNNIYWRDQRSGFIWKSSQWISTDVGAFIFERAFR